MKLHKNAIPCLVRGGYRPHTAPHGGPERRTYFGLLQRAILAQFFGSKVKPTVKLANLPSKRFASIHRQARCVVQQTTTAAVVASICNRSNQAPRLASGARLWASFRPWRETRRSGHRRLSVPDAPETELASFPVPASFISLFYMSITSALGRCRSQSTKRKRKRARGDVQATKQQQQTPRGVCQYTTNTYLPCIVLPPFTSIRIGCYRAPPLHAMLSCI